MMSAKQTMTEFIEQVERNNQDDESSIIMLNYYAEKARETLQRDNLPEDTRQCIQKDIKEIEARVSRMKVILRLGKDITGSPDKIQKAL